MAFLVFALSLVLLAAGLASAYMSLDLLPTSIGVLYALSGAVAGSIAVLTFALGVAIRRIDALAALVRRLEAQPAAASPPAEVAHIEPTFAGDISEATAEHHDDADADALADAIVEPPALAEEAEAPINENRAGHLPTFGATEPIAEAPAALVGRYTSGGANYMIFSDGSIEAETTDGTFKFTSMGEFKRFIADRREEKA